MLERNKVLSVARQEIIEINKSSLTTKTITNIFLPAKRQGLAIHILTILNFMLGYVKKK